MRHVQRARHAIDQADPQQQQQGRRQVDRDVMQPRADPHLSRPVQQQAIGRGQQHLEKDEQVEQVAGQERAVQTDQQELEQRKVMLPLPMPGRPRIDQRRQRQHRCQQQHHRRQVIQHQDDRHRRGPVPQQVEADVLGPFGRAQLGAHQQRHRHRQGQPGRDQAEPEFRRALAVVIKQHQRAGDEGDQDRGDDQVLAHGCSLSRPSTWSVPVNPREAISTTRNSAVVAKLMTMAVRTSAWGSGSA